MPNLNCLHIPVATVDRHNRILDVYCQECFIPMTKEEHQNYFRNRPLPGPIDYINPGDPSDVLVLGSTDPPMEETK